MEQTAIYTHAHANSTSHIGEPTAEEVTITSAKFGADALTVQLSCRNGIVLAVFTECMKEILSDLGEPQSLAGKRVVAHFHGRKLVGLSPLAHAF